MKKNLIAAIPLVLILTGCGKMMDENQCLVADWRTIGFQDGSAGRDMSWLERRGEACAEFGVRPDMDQYLMGRDQGLANYCQPRRGFEIGRRGGTYNNVCAQQSEGQFLAAYQDGRGLRERENHVSSLDHAINDTINAINALENQLTEDAIALAMTDMTTQQRIDYALTIKEMAEERGALQQSLPQMQAELEAARADLSAFASSIAGRYPGAI
ncbi:DUF2799 domain-containing protein [Pseudemcibacter aquimaris]|uniref:DUF2799 domain-containing protein n=1 Tax=Pseudemcibacter aquimaris TaxID=2857064 RepID=UPI002011200B|nr:DUF2799 domain-containing protein [Pseudemcibacter aquimaris]MCC3859891.1 DUF2799 domain-containing protein [Pseudemcibacter aquimaris]WDU57223.1 DUF2799 domain-containing protein [Pseudemcibacter aquimaris]